MGATALVGTLCLMPAAFAQTTDATGPQTATSPASPATGIEQKIEEGEDGTLPISSGDREDRAGNNDIVITGSRIRVRSTIDAAVPVATVSAAELLGTRGDVSVGDALNQLPQLGSTYSQANSTTSIGTAGLSLLDLRRLGTSRTLTLVNGRRVVTAVPGSYTPDVSTFPSDLIQSVELVTGGNSAIYGSDAIAGVVNFRLRRDYEGFRIRGQGGVTSYGDRGTYLVSAIGGQSLFDGKVNVTASAEYTHANSVFYTDRDYLGAYTGSPGFITSQITNAPNRNFDGVPNASFVSNGIVFGSRSTGGVIQTSCPSELTTGTAAQIAANRAQRAAVCTGSRGPAPVNANGVLTGALGTALAYNYLFRPNGSLIADSPATTGLVDNRGIGGGFLFGETATGTEDAQLLPAQDRLVSNLMLSGDFSPAFRPFIEATYVRVKVEQQSTQPTFNGGTITNVYSYNNPFLTPEARQTLITITNPANPNTGTFNLFRFNNDFGTRAEFHTRETYRGVIGAEGVISSANNLRYEVTANYGRTENFYRTGGNVLIQNYNRAAAAVLAPATFTGSNFVLNSAGQRVICQVNAASNTDPNCFPLNPFGRGAFDQRALNYVLYTSTRNQWAEEIDATASISGDSAGIFSLPGGPVGFAAGVEYRREDAFSGQDPITAATPSLTFLNPAATFDPPAVNIKEAFGEIRVPLLANTRFFEELTAEGAVRVSDYGGTTGSVVAWNAGGIWAPSRSFRVRATYARSVRAPNLSNLYASSAQTFVSVADPCNQANGIGVSQTSNITTNPNRVRNCAAAGIPTTITFTNPQTGEVITAPWTNISSSNIPGINRGNPDLTPEIGNSFTVGLVFTPEFLPGFTFKTDYYNIRVNNVISGLTGQAIINRCYDDPTGIDNSFCGAIFRRASSDPTLNGTFNGQTGRTINSVALPNFPIAGDGVAFINQPYNFAQYRSRGIDFDAAYTRKINEDVGVNLRLVVSYVLDRQNFFYIAEPGRFDRIDSTLGDPRWRGKFNAGVNFGNFDISYDAQYVGKQIVSGLGYETFFTNQGRGPTNPDARPFVFYDPVVYHNIRLGLNTSDKKFRFYLGVDNVSNELPPYDLTGTGDDALYSNTGRFLYAGIEAKF